MVVDSERIRQSQPQKIEVRMDSSLDSTIKKILYRKDETSKSNLDLIKAEININ